MPHDTISLELSIEEINLLLESLGELPFRRVFQLIGRIQGAARAQIALEGGDPSTAKSDDTAAIQNGEEVPA